MMFEGKERRGELIAELRESEQELADLESTKKEDALNQQAERGIQVLEGAMDTLQGEAISATLDFLSKELVRKNEQERLRGIASAVAPIANLAGTSEEQQDDTIRDLVASFLLPEVERHRVRQQIQEEE